MEIRDRIIGQRGESIISYLYEGSVLDAIAEVLNLLWERPVRQLSRTR